MFFQSLGVFGLCQIHSFIDYLRANLSKDNFNYLFKTLAIAVGSIVGLGLAVLTLSGKVTIFNVCKGKPLFLLALAVVLKVLVPKTMVSVRIAENRHFHGGSNTSKWLFHLQNFRKFSTSKKENFENQRTSENVFYFFKGFYFTFGVYYILTHKH